MSDYSVEGWAGMHALVFSTTVAHGRGKRRVQVVVPTKDLLRLAACIKAQGDGHEGHALWHFQFPKLPMPCSSCSPLVPE